MISGTARSRLRSCHAGDVRLVLGSSGGDSLEPGGRLQPLEDLARLGEALLLAVLEQRDCEPERDLELAETGGRGPVARLVFVQPRSEAVCPRRVAAPPSLGYTGFLTPARLFLWQSKRTETETASWL